MLNGLGLSTSGCGHSYLPTRHPEEGRAGDSQKAAGASLGKMGKKGMFSGGMDALGGMLQGGLPGLTGDGSPGGWLSGSKKSGTKAQQDKKKQKKQKKQKRNKRKKRK